MEYLRYLLLTSVYAMVLWGIYAATLRNGTDLRASRIFLILAIILAPLLPLLHFSSPVLPSPVFLAALPEVRIGATGTTPDTAPTLNFLVWIYGAVSLCFAVSFVVGYFRLRSRLLRKPAATNEGYRLVLGTGIGPGTLGRRIFFPGTTAEPGILRHEIGHIRAGHRYDLILLAISRSLLWISPAHWLLSRELRIVHEFEADRYAASVVPAEDFAALLLCEHFRVPTTMLIHSFYHHPIKRRIMMLQKTARKGTGKMLTLAALLTAGFAGSVALAQTKGTGTAGSSIAAVSRTPLDPDHLQRTYGRPVPGTVTETPDGRIVLSNVDQMPRFDGNMGKWLIANVRSPEKEMQGKVVVQFIVDAAGNVTMPMLKQSSNNPRLDAEAMRVVRSMPKWKPGMQHGAAVPVIFTLPFNFGSIGEGC